MESSLVIKIKTRTVIDEVTGCWRWQGMIKNTYGFIKTEGKTRPVHRIIYEAYKGVIPDGYHIDHLCGVRSCVNPDHLEAVTPGENAIRGNGATMIIHRSDHFFCGHPKENNTYVIPSTGGRTCHQCMKDKANERNRKKRLTS